MNISKKLNLVPEENESVSQNNVQTSNPNLKSIELKKMKELSLPRGNRSVYLCKYSCPPSKRNSTPLCVRSNSSAQAVLLERKVEIKDLESQVVYFQNRIKELKVENKTIADIQTRQEKELRKIKGGVADIPALLRSHKDEIKALESTASSLRRELWECQKELKEKCDVILKKDQQLNKLNLTVKRIEKSLQEINIEKEQLKQDKKNYEDETKKLVSENEELKSKTDRSLKTIQLLTSEILNFKEKLGSAEHYKAQLEDDLNKLQKKYEDLLHNEIQSKKSIQNTSQTVSTQTRSKETVSVACMTVGSVFDRDVKNANSKLNAKNFKEITNFSNITLTENGHCSQVEYSPFDCLSPNFESGAKKILLEPLNSTSTMSMKISEEHDFGDHIGIDLSKTIAQSFSINSAPNANKSHPNIFITKNSYGGNRTKNQSYEEKYFSKSNNNFLSNEKPKQRPLYSNFTLKHNFSPDTFTNFNKK